MSVDETRRVILSPLGHTLNQQKVKMVMDYHSHEHPPGQTGERPPGLNGAKDPVLKLPME